jgi:hypothetical protein
MRRVSLIKAQVEAPAAAIKTTAHHEPERSMPIEPPPQDDDDDC